MSNNLSRMALLTLATLVGNSGCSSSSDQANPPDDDPTGAIINTGNHEYLLEFLFSVANAEFYRPLTDTIEAVYGDDPVGIPDEQDFLTEISSAYDQTAAVMRYDYACGEGGSYHFVDPGSAVGGGSGRFDACAFQGTEHNGSFVRDNTLVKYVYSPGWLSSTTYTGFSQTATAEAESAIIDGRFEQFTGDSENTERWDITRLELGGDSAGTQVKDALIQWYAGDQSQNPDDYAPWQRSFSASFTVTAPQTSDNTLSVITEQPFVTNERNGTYTQGSLLIVAIDGSELRVQAANGDPASFQVDISSDGSASSFTVPWSGHLRLRCLASPDETNAIPDTCR